NPASPGTPPAARPRSGTGCSSLIQPLAARPACPARPARAGPGTPPAAPAAPAPENRPAPRSSSLPPGLWISAPPIRGAEIHNHPVCGSEVELVDVVGGENERRAEQNGL